MSAQLDTLLADQRAIEARAGLISAAAEQAHSALHTTLAKAYAHHPDSCALLAALERDSIRFAQRIGAPADGHAAQSFLIGLLRGQVIRLMSERGAQ